MLAYFETLFTRLDDLRCCFMLTPTKFHHRLSFAIVIIIIGDLRYDIVRDFQCNIILNVMYKWYQIDLIHIIDFYFNTFYMKYLDSLKTFQTSPYHLQFDGKSSLVVSKNSREIIIGTSERRRLKIVANDWHFRGERGNIRVEIRVYFVQLASILTIMAWKVKNGRYRPLGEILSV